MNVSLEQKPLDFLREEMQKGLKLGGSAIKSDDEVAMAPLTPEASQLLEKALTLSSEDRGVLIDRLIQSLDAAAEEGAEQAWSDEIKGRVDDVRSGRVEMISGEEVRRRLRHRLLHGRE